MMQATSGQLALGLRLRDEATFENFYGKRNQEIVLQLQKTASGQGEQAVYLSGARGQGCSHLLQACCHYSYQHKRTSVYLPLSELITLTSEVLIGLETLSLVCVDDLHVVAGKIYWEEAIFHLFNRVMDAGGRIVLAGEVAPKNMKLGLPDLESRLSSGIVFQLDALTDDEKLDALIARAYRRGITLSDEVGRYILSHLSRHMASLFAALDALDQASLAEQRRLTIPFVKQVLDIK